MKGRKKIISNKKLVSTVTFLVILVAITFCLLNTVGALQIVQLKTNSNTILNPIQLDKKGPIGPNPRSIVWDVQLNFSETGGKTDYVYFGEAPDARDGPPADIYDVAKPPAPMPPYIRAYMNDSLPSPYKNMWKDYRLYPDTEKVWNLSVKWLYEDGGETPTDVTMVWSTNKINLSEYDTVWLYDNSGNPLVNMRTTSSYTYTSPDETTTKFKIRCYVDIKPPEIINNSPGTGETGDSYTFNATVIDNISPTSSLLVKVNWIHGSLSGNDTMTSMGGNYFVKTITLDNLYTGTLTYHFYAKDNAKVPNVNYTSTLSAPISDDEDPTITGDSGNVVVGTGNMVTLWVSATDNVGVTSAKATIDSVDHAMTFNSGNSHWEYVYTAPGGSTAGHLYTVSVYDLAGNSATSVSHSITVNDDDNPVITGDSGNVVVGTGNMVTLWVSATDNVGVTSAKATIDSVDHAMTFNSGNSHWEYVYTAPGGSTAGHLYTVSVYDLAGNSATSVSHSITVNDDDNPVITGDSGNVVVGTGNMVTLWVSATDNVGVTSAKATIDSVDHAMTFNSGNSHWEYVYTAPGGSTAGHLYTVSVYDLAGNSATSVSHSITVNDDDNPVITGDSGNVVVGTGNMVTLWVSATDNVGVTSAKATIDSVDHAMTFNSGNSHWEYVYTAPGGSTAGHLYTVSVYDLAGNSATSVSHSITVNDDDNPVITGDSGNVVVGTGNMVTLWVSATDNVGVTSAKATIDSVDHAMTFNSGNSHWEYVYTAPGGSTAGHLYTVSVYDLAGNSATSVSHSITVNDDDNPVITGDSGNVVVGTGNMVTLWVSATDNVGVTSAKATIDSVDHAMTFNSGNSHWEYVYTAPGGSTAGHLYTVSVYDLAGNSATSVSHSITVNDDDNPVITGDSGNVVVGTGNMVTLWVSATDNVGVTSAKATIDSVDHAMTFNSGNSHWEYVYTAPGGSTAGHLYTVSVYDLAGNSATSVSHSITVNDDDTPLITDILTTPTHQLINEYVNITATITDNINVNIVKVNISGPSGFTNVSMIKDGGDTYFKNNNYALVGIYTYYIWVKDSSNNGIRSADYQFEIFAELQVTSLKTGWNFFSLPFNLTTPKTNLFVMSGSTRYTWGQAVSNNIVVNAIYNWTRATQKYNITTTLIPGEGFWVYAYSDCDLWATNLTPIITNDFITLLKHNWSTFGVPIGSTVSKTNLKVNYLGTDYTWADAVTNNYVMNDIFGWQRTAPQSYFIAFNLDPGYCYWIYAYVDCNLKRTI